MALNQQHNLPGRPAVRNDAVRFRRVGQGEGVADDDLQVAGGEVLHQVEGGGGDAVGAAHPGGQPVADYGEILVHQLDGGELGALAASRADDDQASKGSQGLQALIGDAAAHYLQHDIDPAPSGGLFYLLNPAILRIVDGGIGSQAAYKVKLLLVAGGADDLASAHEAGELHGERSHATGGCLHQHAFAGLESARLAQCLIGGQALHGKGGGMGEIEAFRDGDNSGGTGDGIFSIASYHKGDHAGSYRRSAGFRAERRDSTGHLEPQRHRGSCAREIGSPSLRQVGIVDTGSRDFDQNFTLRGGGSFHVFKMHDFGTACFMDTNCFHVLLSLPFKLFQSELQDHSITFHLIYFTGPNEACYSELRSE